MKTQLQHYESERRKIADRNNGFIFIHKTNPPTKEELSKLRKSNPRLWNLYPDNWAVD